MTFFFGARTRARSLATLSCARNLTIILASGFVCSAAFAQEDPNNLSAASEIYTADFFQRFRPQSALDIILQVPGFTFDKGEDVRGFGGAAGNVLINGARPSSKSGGIEDALKRIPAAQVERVEIIHGNAGAGETAGQAVIVNLIRRRSMQSGRWSVGLRYPKSGRLSPDFEAVVTRPFGEWDGAFKLNGLYKHSSRDAAISRSDALGALVFTQDETRNDPLTDLFLSADLGRKYDEKVLQLTSRFGFSRYRTYTDRSKFLSEQAGVAETFSSDRNSRYLLGELGVDWTQPLGNGYKWRLIGLATGQHWWVVNPSETTELLNASNTSSDYRFVRDKFEGILRTTLSDTKGRFQPEFGVELAYNLADFDISLSRQQNGEHTVVTLPASDVLVKELRGEAFVNATWQILGKLSVETGLATEVSRIMVSGDADNSQTLSYLKPKAAFVYRLNDVFQTRLAYARSVGQLNFSDFAASANFETNQEFGGNPALKPHGSSRLSATSKWTYTKGGALNVELFYEWRNDVLEQTLLPSGAYGIGNAGDATLKGLEASLTAPLGFVIDGAQITAKTTVQKSTFLDPISDQNRRLNYEDKPTLEIQFRHDPGSVPISWGGSFSVNNDNLAFYPNEASVLSNRSRWDAFIETSVIEGLRLRLDVTNEGTYWKRSFYEPDRGGKFLGAETHDRDNILAFKVTVSGQF